MSFFSNLISSSDEVSSKRFIALYSLVLLTIVIVCALYGVVINDTIIYALVSLILGNSALTLVQTNSKTETKSDEPKLL